MLNLKIYTHIPSGNNSCSSSSLIFLLKKIHNIHIGILELHDHRTGPGYVTIKPHTHLAIVG